MAGSIGRVDAVRVKMPDVLPPSADLRWCIVTHKLSPRFVIKEEEGMVLTAKGAGTPSPSGASE